MKKPHSQRRCYISQTTPQHFGVLLTLSHAYPGGPRFHAGACKCYVGWQSISNITLDLSPALPGASDVKCISPGNFGFDHAVILTCQLPNTSRGSQWQNSIWWSSELQFVNNSFISTMYFSHWEPPAVSERMWSAKLEASISGEYQTLGGHSS